MNYSLQLLSLQQVISSSPIISLTYQSKESFITLTNSKFNKVSNNFLFSSSSVNAKVYGSSFNKFLKSTIKVGSATLHAKTHYVLTKKNGRIDLDKDVFKECSDENGGAFFILECKIIVTNCEFTLNSGKIGGAIRAYAALSTTLKRNLFYANYADYNGAVFIDTNDIDDVVIQNCNFTQNAAKLWNGALRLDRCGGKLHDCYFDRNQAKVSAAFFDYSSQPHERSVKNCLFLQNECVSRGAYTAFHILQKSSLSECIFAYNKCNISANSISLESIRITIDINQCFFTGSYESEIGVKYSFSTVEIDKETQFIQDSILIPSLVKMHIDKKKF